MLKNCNVRLSNEGNVLIEIPLGIKDNMNESQVYEQLQKIINDDRITSKEFNGRDNKSTTYYYLSSIQGEGYKAKYDSIIVGGVELKIALDTVITSDIIEGFNPNKVEKPTANGRVKTSKLSYEKALQMLKDGFLTKKEISEMIKDGRIVE